MGSKSRDFRSDLHLFFVIFILRSLFLQTALFSYGFHLKCGEIRQKSTHKCGFLPASFLSMQLGARGGSRTRTPLRALAPEASESTNSTTRAKWPCSARMILYHIQRGLSTAIFPLLGKICAEIFVSLFGRKAVRQREVAGPPDFILPRNVPSASGRSRR